MQHLTVENDFGTACKSLAEELNRLGANIQSHPAIFDTSSRDHLERLCVLKLHWFLRESGRADCINREIHLFTLFFCLLDEIICSFNHTFFAETGSNGNALSFSERIGKASSEDKFVDLVQQSLDDGKLRRHLGSTNDYSIRRAQIREVNQILFFPEYPTRSKLIRTYSQRRSRPAPSTRSRGTPS